MSVLAGLVAPPGSADALILAEFGQPMPSDVASIPVANTLKFVWGAMGDSYASGEGNPSTMKSDPLEYEDFTGLRWTTASTHYTPVALAGVSAAADSTTCHRSGRAPAAKANGQLRSLYGFDIVMGNASCSGAEIADVVVGGYTGPGTSEAAMLEYTRVVQPAQVRRMLTLKANQGRLDAVYMSIGGNDSGFGDILTQCLRPFFLLGPLDCRESGEAALAENLRRLPTKYDDLDLTLDALLPAVPVLISTYPNPLDERMDPDDAAHICDGSDWDVTGLTGPGQLDDYIKVELTRAEANWAKDAPSRINQVVRSAASANGWRVVDSHLDAFAGRGMCTPSPYFNLNSRAVWHQGRDIPDTLAYNYSTGFVHPNDAGQNAYAAAIVSTLRPLVNVRATAGLRVPTTLRAAAATSTSLTIRWKDMSSTDNAYDVEVVPATADVGTLVKPAGGVAVGAGGYRVRLTGVNVQQHVIGTTRAGEHTVRVRACNKGSGTCSAWTATANVTNRRPSVPTGVTSTVAGSYTKLAWTPSRLALDYVVRARSSLGTLVTFRTSSTSTTVSRFAYSNLVVAACNRAGCSNYVSP